MPSETELDAARAENQRGIAGVHAAQAQVMQAQAQVSSAQTNLSKATIYSPVNGVVLSRQIDPGQTVAASFQAPVLFTIAEDLAAMKLEVRVDEADVGQVHAGPARDLHRRRLSRPHLPGDGDAGRRRRQRLGLDDLGIERRQRSAATGSVVAYTAILAVAESRA